MRLRDLDAKFAAYKGESGQFLVFDCPCGCKTRLAVALSSPIGGTSPAAPAKTHWAHTGEDIETLTLSPSVNFVGHWHGWIRDGEVTSC